MVFFSLDEVVNPVKKEKERHYDQSEVKVKIRIYCIYILYIYCTDGECSFQKLLLIFY